jgi:hypothetical protein
MLPAVGFDDTSQRILPGMPTPARVVSHGGPAGRFNLRLDCVMSQGELRIRESPMLHIRCRPTVAFAAVAIAAAALCGCGTDHAREAREERAAIFPDNYRAEIIAFMKTYLNDPTNVRDAYMAEPKMKEIGSHKQYVVCVRFNAKNTDGRYMGSKDAMALFDGGRFEHMVDQFPKGVVNQCADADYKRFPELEALKR